jgi:Uma2 family endonuclease
MSIHESTSNSDFPIPSPVAHRFSVNRYHRMIETGVLSENDKVELVEGLIVEMAAFGVPHRYAVDESYLAITKLLPAGWKSFVQQPITLAESELEPDVSVVRGTGADYKDHHPRPSEIGLLIEVADTSLEFDRVTKGRLYAAARIAEYWIVNLNERQIEVYQEPQGEAREAAYRSLTTFSATEKVPLRVGGNDCGQIAVAAVLP